MILPAMDVLLMKDHLKTHEGMLYKLRIYFHHAHHPLLKEIIQRQYTIMNDHVRVMLELLDPNRTTPVRLAAIDLDIVPKGDSNLNGTTEKQDKPLSFEGRATAKFMANHNFMSSLLMKNPHVKEIHEKMAIQQAKIAESYTHLIQHLWREKPTMSTAEVQLEIINDFKDLLHS
ncbi:hypothetical protein ACFSCX_16340 [Bacillus salitolerans]|uniref:Spore coat protein n=1 Tax=Bacillus salitolerans TaxID=1437434 RepID=A0ABW4LTJ5_9BACI